jgi:hypothetical protein
MIGVLLTFAVLSSPAASCPLERANYVLRDAPGFTAGFRPVATTPDWPVNTAFFVRSAKSGKTYWFLLYFGNGVGTHGHLASTYDVTRPGWNPPHPDSAKERPLGDLDYMVLDADYRFQSEGLVRHGSPPPAHILIPDLSGALWYRTPSGQREGAPMAFFDLTGCEP